MNPSDNKRLLAALNENWQAEMEGFSTYSALAKNENDPHRRNASRGLARAEKHHANLWAGRIKALGGIEPQYNGDPAGQSGSLANRVGGPDLALRSLITIRSWWASGFEMTWIGALEGVVTYIIGIGLGKIGRG